MLSLLVSPCHQKHDEHLGAVAAAARGDTERAKACTVLNNTVLYCMLTPFPPPNGQQVSAHHMPSAQDTTDRLCSPNRQRSITVFVSLAPI